MHRSFIDIFKACTRVRKSIQPNLMLHSNFESKACLFKTSILTSEECDRFVGNKPTKKKNWPWQWNESEHLRLYNRTCFLHSTCSQQLKCQPVGSFTCQDPRTQTRTCCVLEVSRRSVPHRIRNYRLPLPIFILCFQRPKIMASNDSLDEMAFAMIWRCRLSLAMDINNM